MTYKKRQTAEAVCLKETNHLSLVWEVGNFWDKERGRPGDKGKKIPALACNKTAIRRMASLYLPSIFSRSVSDMENVVMVYLSFWPPFLICHDCSLKK